MLRADGGDLYWLEGRPGEGGRTALCRLRGDGGRHDVAGPGFDVGSRVHEYGGGAYAVADGQVAFSERRDGSLWLTGPGLAPRLVASVPGLRFADLLFTPGARALIAVREDHRQAGEPTAAIVRLDLDAAVDPARNEGAVLVLGPTFLAAPRLSPDGAQLAWIAWDHPDMPWDHTRLMAGRLCARGIADARILAGGGQPEALMQPEFAPDGTLCVCSDRSGWWSPWRVVAGPGGEAGLEPLLPQPPGGAGSEVGAPHWVFGQRCYRWTPDGQLLLAATGEGRTTARTAACSIDGAEVLALPIGGVEEAPVWLERPEGPCLAWLRAVPDRPAAVMLAAIADLSNPVEIAAAHARLLPDADISRPEAIRFPTEGGATGHAFHYPPTSSSFRPLDGERPPLVVMVHGGPTAMAGDALSLRTQFWTSRGIGVLDVNYGGSTGFGRDYRQRLDGHWGVVDVEDCIAACRHLVAAGRVDPGRIAIRGSSAGGFTVLAALVRSDLFSAAACLYGVSDLRQLAAETHKFEARYMDRLVGPLPQAAATYAQRSPLSHVGAIRTPVIFFHGLEDKVVPPAQTRAMADALGRQGVAVELHEFAGEGHGFRREETIRRVLELELAFYGRCFGFNPAPA